MPLPSFDPGADYYWIGTAQVRDGARVRPGSWGRLIRLMGALHNWAYREAIWELARREVAPDAPSRLECIFLCQDQAAAENLRAQDQRPLDLIYRVRIVDTDAPACVTDMQLVSDFNTLDPTLPTIPGQQVLPKTGVYRMDNELKLARNYWRGETSGIARPEVLTSSEIEILAALD